MRWKFAGVLTAFVLTATFCGSLTYGQNGLPGGPGAQIPNSGGGGSASTGLTLAPSNMTFNVATTGSDSNPCSSGSPCLTIQHAVNVAASYNWANKYTATINVADGTYAASVILPALFNYPYSNVGTYPYDNSPSFPLLQGNLTTPTNCKIQSSTTDAVSTQATARWQVKGFQVKSTTGTNFDILAQYYSSIGIDKIDFAGSGNLAGAWNYSTVYALNATLTSSTASAFNAINAVYYSGFINDGGTFTFNNSPNFTNYVVSLEDWGFVGNGTFVNGGTVTGKRARLVESSIWEANLTRINLPGNGIVQINPSSFIFGDTNSNVVGSYVNTSASLANTVSLSDGAGTLWGDFGITGSGNWTFSPTNTFQVSTSNTGYSAFQLNNSSSGAHNLLMFTAGSGGVLGVSVGQFGWYDLTSGDYTMVMNGATSEVDLFGVLGWSTGKTSWTAIDAGLSRLGAASVALGNGTAGDFTGTLKLAHLTATALANSATTSAVCYNTGTGVLTYDGTIGTCTTSDERLKNMGERIPDALNKLLQINGVSYTWKDPQYGTGPQIGVGAQTVERVFPELVQTGSDGYKSVDYQRLTAPIIEALRELKADNDNLRACQNSWKCRLFGSQN